jgi:HPr kinase/phosphorylase
MNAPPVLNIHASCVVIGERGVLIRGASGSGKSRLALRLMQQARLQNRFFALVSDDRTLLTPCRGRAGDRLIARPHPLTAGILERRGIGLVKSPHQSAARVDLVIDLQADLPERLPDQSLGTTILANIRLIHLFCAIDETDPAFAAVGLDLWAETVIT